MIGAILELILSESLDKLYAMLVASADKDLEYLEMSG